MSQEIRIGVIRRLLRIVADHVPRILGGVVRVAEGGLHIQSGRDPQGFQGVGPGFNGGERVGQMAEGFPVRVVPPQLLVGIRIGVRLQPDVQRDIVGQAPRLRPFGLLQGEIRRVGLLVEGVALHIPQALVEIGIRRPQIHLHGPGLELGVFLQRGVRVLLGEIHQGGVAHGQLARVHPLAGVIEHTDKRIDAAAIGVDEAGHLVILGYHFALELIAGQTA